MIESNKEESRKAFVLPTRTLDLLGGEIEKVVVDNQEVSIVSKGAYLWGVDALEVGKGVFNHACVVGRYSWYLAKELRNKSESTGDGKYNGLDERIAAEAGVIHDVGKLRFAPARIPGHVGIEDLSSKGKKLLGYSPDFQEISTEADEEIIKWLKEEGIPQEVIDGVRGHDFPVSEAAVETPYQQILMMADYACGQDCGIVRERLNDVYERWILNYVVNKDDFPNKEPIDIVRDNWKELEFGSDEAPRISPERAAKAAEIIEGTARELFNYLETTEEEFIREYNLNSEISIPPWEKVLRNAWKKDFSHQSEGGKGAPRSDKVKAILQRQGN